MYGGKAVHFVYKLVEKRCINLGKAGHSVRPARGTIPKVRGI